MLFEKNTLFYGDNLEVLKKYFPDECVDLIYLDPPFNSQKNYNILFKEKTGTNSKAQIQAFSDFWEWDKVAEETYLELQCGDSKIRDMVQAFHTLLGRKNDMFAYLVMMTIRLIELKRVLKDTGSIYLHCDPTASHYLKIVMDKIFGVENFRNEIVWHYVGGGWSKNYWSAKHDTIFLYSKTKDYIFNVDDVRVPYDKGTIDRNKYILAGKIRPINPRGRLPDDVWDIPALRQNAKERLGYPTQKPGTLLERIIKASSNEGDLVLDPFCGCGTTIAAAQKLNRKWVGIDITHLAITVIKSRLEKSRIYSNKDYDIRGVPVDFEGAKKLAEQDKYQFQYWAGSLIQGFYPVGESKKSPYGKRGADKGVDGWLTFEESNHIVQKVVVQVKSGYIDASVIRDLIGTANNTDSAMGVLITLQEPTKPMKQAAFEAGTYEAKLLGGSTPFPKIQIITVEQLMNGEKLNLPNTIRR